MAIHAGHLGAGRRAVPALMARGLERWVVPMMQREGW
jgi:hypothetical protein